jgi:hypothetical protein
VYRFVNLGNSIDFRSCRIRGIFRWNDGFHENFGILGGGGGCEGLSSLSSDSMEGVISFVSTIVVVVDGMESIIITSSSFVFTKKGMNDSGNDVTEWYCVNRWKVSCSTFMNVEQSVSV